MKSVVLFAVLASVLSLRIQKEAPVKARTSPACGIVLGAFGEKYGAAGAKVAKHIRSLSVTKGWCPDDPSLDYVPVTLFTDDKNMTKGVEYSVKMLQIPTKEEQKTFADYVKLSADASETMESELKSENGCPAGVDCYPETSMGDATGLYKKQTKHVGSWGVRWYHSQMMVRSPYVLSVYLDLDAMPCSGDKIGELLHRLRDSNAAIGSVIHSNHPCLTSGNNCASPHPEGASAGEFSHFKERNAGAVVFDRRLAKPVLKDFGKYILESVDKKSVIGDQYAFRSALFMHRADVKELLFKDNEICRYDKKMTCAKGCAIFHKKDPKIADKLE